MYIKRRYGFFKTFIWSSKAFIIGFIYSSVIALISYYSELDLSLPWQPLGTIGIAVAFYLGFKNNSSYDRVWEARKIYGGLVNSSRTFGASVVSFVQGEDTKLVNNIKKELIYRHIAWLIALRYQLRLSREWEHQNVRLDDMFNSVVCEDYIHKLDDELISYIDQEEIDKLNGVTNVATQIMKTQSIRLQELKDHGYYEDFRHMAFHSLVKEFYTDQGKAERIKNFPFPRQYASAATFVSFVFSILVPFGMLTAFHDMSGMMLIFVPILSALVIWIFFLMEKIGDFSENPFEGTYNDVPITNISRGIEIDLREMINDDSIPEPIKAIDGYLL